MCNEMAPESKIKSMQNLLIERDSKTVYNIISVHSFILMVSYHFIEVRPWGPIHRGQKVEVLAEPGSP